jgi:cellulose synthase/poly-beta-1,6-N-acetylglucosamine synthase-like glycosyltransferase
VRRGKFKKASNMNFALMVSNKVEDKLLTLSRPPSWSQQDEDAAYQKCLNEVIEESNGKAWASGNIRLGDYVLLVDSDTRVPTDCLLDAASEMEASPEIAILQYSSGVMKVTNTFFEVCVFISSNSFTSLFMFPSILYSENCAEVNTHY